jgi:hypothetical protein
MAKKAVPKKKIEYIRPQQGYQEIALSSEADIVIGGAAAFVGKTFALLLDPLRYVGIPDFGGVIFRRTSVQIRNEGGLWDTSMKLYPIMKAEPRESSLDWQFPSGSKLSFRHLEYEKNKFDWQGAQIPFLGFDELTHFSETMFFYLLSRNRSSCGVKPYVRATCNPDPESWVYKLIDWWIDKETGYPILERRGVLRYFIKYGDSYIWGSSYDDVKDKAWHIISPLIEQSGLYAEDFIKSITFVSGSIYDNKRGLELDPSYPGNLLSQDEDTRRQLLEGRWKVSVSPNDIFDHGQFIEMFNDDGSSKDEVKKNIPRYITADIAMKGSNKLVVGYWEGMELKDIEIMDKSDGRQVIDLINKIALKYDVQNRYICYDSDGVGAYIDGFIKGAVAFNGGGGVLATQDPTSGRMIKENYFNLKTQCYYRMGDRVNRGSVKISQLVGNKMYDSKMTIKQRFMFERRAIKRDKIDSDGKLRINSKDDQKTKLNGDSPDLLDMLMMREIFELKPKIVFAYADN